MKCFPCKGTGYAGPTGDTCQICEGSGVPEPINLIECPTCKEDKELHPALDQFWCPYCD